jgi:hypothetical protein
VFKSLHQSSSATLSAKALFDCNIMYFGFVEDDLPHDGSDHFTLFDSHEEYGCGTRHLIPDSLGVVWAGSCDGCLQ